MENLPENLFDDDGTDGASSSVESEAAVNARIRRYITLLTLPLRKPGALEQLAMEGQRCKDLPLLLWNSDEINAPLFLVEEICSAHHLLSPPHLIDEKEATRVLHAITLVRHLADHPGTRMALIRAMIPIHVYPFMDVEVQGNMNLEGLRISSLWIIVRLVGVEDTNTPEIIHFLLKTEVLSKCLRCIDVGSELAKKGATFVIRQILMSKEGQQYIGRHPDRIYSVAMVLRKTVQQFERKPPTLQLLREVLNCFMQLVEVSRLFGTLGDVSEHHAAKLKDVISALLVQEIKRFENLMMYCSNMRLARHRES